MDYQADTDLLVDCFECQLCQQVRYTSTGAKLFYKKRCQLGKYIGIACGDCVQQELDPLSYENLNSRYQSLIHDLLLAYREKGITPYARKINTIYDYHFLEDGELEQSTDLLLREITAENIHRHFQPLLSYYRRLETDDHNKNQALETDVHNCDSSCSTTDQSN